MTEGLVILERLRALGVTVIAHGDRLRIQPGSRVPPELVATVRSHKAELLDLLQGEGRRQHDFHCWVLEEWRRASIPDWRRILQESIARGDRKREEYARWMLGEVLLDPEYRGPTQ